MTTHGTDIWISKEDRDGHVNRVSRPYGIAIGEGYDRSMSLK